jgi:EAL domain-containing protein (putative c-di-GMP-specific phosphodiesterase class I)
MTVHSFGTSALGSHCAILEWPSMTSTRRALLAGRRDLPIVEMKVGRKFIRGCADDRIKQARCAEIVAIARESGARSVAEGMDRQSDFLAVRDLGFD